MSELYNIAPWHKYPKDNDPENPYKKARISMGSASCQSYWGSGCFESKGEYRTWRKTGDGR